MVGSVSHPVPTKESVSVLLDLEEPAVSCVSETLRTETLAACCATLVIFIGSNSNLLSFSSFLFTLTLPAAGNLIPKFVDSP